MGLSASMRESRVVFPAPLGPVTAQCSPLLMLQEKFLNTMRVPYEMLMSLRLTISSPASVSG